MKNMEWRHFQRLWKARNGNGLINFCINRRKKGGRIYKTQQHCQKEMSRSQSRMANIANDWKFELKKG